VVASAGAPAGVAAGAGGRVAAARRVGRLERTRIPSGTHLLDVLLVLLIS